eukprot:GHUV01021920.1.p1 GENE.GHUV01021920.1~~GHUV01021920.1.p1  ORF type:complete len:632 (+),score=132.80 GHUV01021920.1:114-2009(+)
MQLLYVCLRDITDGMCWHTTSAAQGQYLLIWSQLRTDQPHQDIGPGLPMPQSRSWTLCIQVLQSHRPMASPQQAVNALDPLPPSAHAAAPLEYSNPELDTSSLLKRQVFISHTGQDKDACTFAASILKPMLEGAGLPVYMDFSNLQKGDEYPPQLLEAATCSEVVLVVLSRSFSRRFWCMVELEQALHGTSGRRPVILPVIYHPTEDVDSKAAVMQYWQEWKATELNQSRPDRWHKVVPEHWASNYTYVCDTIQGIRRQQQGPKDTDFQLAREAAKLALQHLSPAPPTEQLFGVAELQADLLKRLTSGKCQGLWLYGEGGIGKTALAKRLFHALASSGKFLSKASVEIKDSDVADSVAQTYQQLNSSGPSDGLSAAGLQAMMRGKKLLLLLDNVSCCEQLDALLPEAYTEGSIIIVTSRMKSCRGSNRQQVIDQLHHLRVEPLDPIPSRELFLEKAGLSTISDNLAGLGNDIIALCNGLPLALQLAGAAMSEHSGNPAIWSGVLAALKKGGLHVDTQQRLQDVVQRRLSAMPHGQQSMFLDVATALSGQPADVVLDVWKDWHGAEAAMWYADLVRNCLLRPSSDDRLQMHDVLAAMGRGMVLDQQSPFYGSRIWVQDNIIVGAVQVRELTP